MLLANINCYAYITIYIFLIQTYRSAVVAQLKVPILEFVYHKTNKFNESIRDTNTFLTEYDFIVIGSGSGGSVVANRLTEIDGFTLLLLEAGDEENFISDVPLTPAATILTSELNLSCNYYGN